MYSYDFEDDLSLRHDEKGIPERFVKTVGKKASGLKPYLCFLVAHDILDDIERGRNHMECFLYRIWTVGPDHADMIFMNLSEVKSYIQLNEDVPNDVKSIFDIDQWDALLAWIELDPLFKNT